MTPPRPLDLLPHRAPALLLAECLELTARGARCRGRVPLEHPAAKDGRAPTVLGLEMAAQAAGLVSLPGESADGPRSGYLVSLRDVELHTPDGLACNTDYLVEVELEGASTRIGLFRFAVRDPGGATLLASGLVGTYLSPTG